MLTNTNCYYVADLGSLVYPFEILEISTILDIDGDRIDMISIEGVKKNEKRSNCIHKEVHLPDMKSHYIFGKNVFLKKEDCKIAIDEICTRQKDYCLEMIDSIDKLANNYLGED